MPFTLTVTNAGRAAIVNAAKDGTNAVRIASVGVSATASTPTAGTATLPGEIKRIATIAGEAVAADTIHVTVRDESNAVYAVRSIALYLSDGTLFASYGQSEVLVEKSAQAMLLLALDVRFADVAAANLTFGATDFLYPPATTEMQGVAELATDAETAAGTDDRRAVTPKGLSFAFNARLGGFGSDIWRASNDGAGSGLDADLLDGQQGSYYANVVARLGYTPLNKSGDTATGRMSFVGGATGGNGVGAQAAGLGEVEVQGNGVGAAMMTFHRPGSFGAYLGFDVDNILKVGGWSLGPTSYTIWHSGTDGAGSGLDADLLDGQDGSFYTNIVARLGYVPAARGGDTFTGNIAIAAPDSAILTLRPPNGNYGYVRLQRGSTPRFDIGMDVSPESGGNAGSNLYINRFDDAGNFIDSPFTILRATGEARVQGGRVWHSANDGAGSGLDADLLDGRQASDFLSKAGDTAVGRIIFDTGASGNGGMGPGYGGGEIEVRGNGVGPAMMAFHRPGVFAGYLGIDSDNRFKVGGWSFGNAAYTLWHSGNDGAGSGLDADLLDGQDGGYYADVVSRLGFWPVRQGTGIGQLSNVVQIGWSGSRVKVTIDASDMGNVVFDNHIADVWRVSNDGAGSGLDADLLDGRQASDFALLDDGSRFGANERGYWERRPNRVIEQWGKVAGPFSESAVAISFPVPFTDPNSVVVLPVAVNASANNRFDITIQRVDISANGCTLMVQYTAASTSINQIDGIDWRAVGR